VVVLAVRLAADSAGHIAAAPTAAAPAVLEGSGASTRESTAAVL
jgi:hypothetical protein